MNLSACSSSNLESKYFYLITIKVLVTMIIIFGTNKNMIKVNMTDKRGLTALHLAKSAACVRFPKI